MPLLRPVVAGAQWGDKTAQILFNAIYRSGDMGSADGFLSSKPDVIVLIVVGKPEHFMRHDMTYVDN
jgi:hypothetical protein